MPNLRVLFLATRDWYNPQTTGGDNTMWENARYLASVGHCVTFVCAGYRGAAKQETRDGIHVVRLGGIHSLWFRTFVHYVVHARGKFDVVVTEGFGGSRIPRLAPLYVRRPILTEWHQVHRDLFAAQYPAPVATALNLLERVTARVHRNTLVRAGTSEWADAFTTIGFRRKNIFIVPVSIRDSFPERRNQIPAQEADFVWLGKIRRYKCPHHAVIALSKVVGSVPSASLTIAGRRDDVHYENEIRQLVSKLHLDERVRFRTDIDEGEKQHLLGSARALILPSAVEGFGIVVLEANAFDTPVIASDRVPEGAVRDDYNGLRYPFADTDRLATLLIHISRNHSLYHRLSSNSTVFAEQFRWTNIGARYESVVVKAAAMPSKAPEAIRGQPIG